jgi:hypothetical protein
VFAMGRVSMGYDSKARRVSSRVVAWPSTLLKAETWAATSKPANSTMTFAVEITPRSTLASDLGCLEFQYFDSEHPDIPPSRILYGLALIANDFSVDQRLRPAIDQFNPFR